SILTTYFSFFHSAAHPPILPSFPTRRSSDLDHRTARRHRYDRSARAAHDDRVPGSASAAAVATSADARSSQRTTLNRESRRSDGDRKSTRLNSSHDQISYAVFCLKKKKKNRS